MLAKSYGRKQNLTSTKYQPTNSDFRAIVRTTQQVIGNRAVVPTGNIIMFSALYLCMSAPTEPYTSREKATGSVNPRRARHGFVSYP